MVGEILIMATAVDEEEKKASIPHHFQHQYKNPAVVLVEEEGVEEVVIKMPWFVISRTFWEYKYYILFG